MNTIEKAIQESYHRWASEDRLLMERLGPGIFEAGFRACAEWLFNGPKEKPEDGREFHVIAILSILLRCEIEVEGIDGDRREWWFVDEWGDMIEPDFWFYPEDLLALARLKSNNLNIPYDENTNLQNLPRISQS